MSAAFRAQMKPTQKLVFLALCDCANDQGECYPSVPTLVEKSSASERTVQDAIGQLERDGYLRREFRTGRSTVYWIADPRKWRTPAAVAPPQDLHPTPANAAPPPPQTAHPTPANAAPITINEPSIEPNTKKAPRERVAPFACPGDVDCQVWADWLQLRKAKRAPVSATVVAGARAEAAKADMTLTAFLAKWCERGSQGLEAAWLKPHERAGPAAETSFTRDRKAAANAWMGTAAPNRTTEVIDMEPTHGTRTALR
jgi:hypothetical protein